MKITDHPPVLGYLRDNQENNQERPNLDHLLPLLGLNYYPADKVVLPDGINFYPTDCVIDSVGTDPESFGEALISILDDKNDLPFNCVVVKSEKVFADNLIEFFEEKDFKTKIDQYPEFLLINLPEGRAHRTLRQALDLRIGGSLQAQLPDTFELRSDNTIQLSTGENKQPDCSFITSQRDQELSQPQSLPNILVEIASSESDKHVKTKIVDFAQTTRTHNDLNQRLRREQSIDVLIVARMNWVRRDGRRHRRSKPPPLSQSRLSSITFVLFLRNSLGVPIREVDSLRDSNTIKIELNEAGAANFAENPGHFGSRRARGFIQRNNLVVPRRLLTGEYGEDVTLVSAAGLLSAAQKTFRDHERLFRVAIPREDPV